jgi:hypothetical protein
VPGVDSAGPRATRLLMRLRVLLNGNVCTAGTRHTTAGDQHPAALLTASTLQ